MAPRQTGERLVQQAQPAPRTPPQQGGGITVPPLPPVQGQGARRPLSSDDFEEELDIPEFLRSQ
jgi:cell division protein FtsZ